MKYNENKALRIASELPAWRISAARARHSFMTHPLLRTVLKTHEGPGLDVHGLVAKVQEVHMYPRWQNKIDILYNVYILLKYVQLPMFVKLSVRNLNSQIHVCFPLHLIVCRLHRLWSFLAMVWSGFRTHYFQSVPIGSLHGARPHSYLVDGCPVEAGFWTWGSC